MRAILFIGLCAWAFLLPLLESRAASRPQASGETGPRRPWPTTFEGRTLRPLPLTSVEKRFAGDFPGEMARFTDGRREILFRRVREATRRLHPSAECLEASGHAVHPLPAWTDDGGRTWSRMEAVKDGKSLTVRETICEEDALACWSDVPAWYWPAMLGRSSGPWTAVTVSETGNGRAD
jgi:hypothetical protein